MTDTHKIARRIAEVIENGIPSDVSVALTCAGFCVEGRRHINDESDIAHQVFISLEDISASRGNILQMAVSHMKNMLDVSEQYYREYPQDVSGGIKHDAEFTCRCAPSSMEPHIQ